MSRDRANSSSQNEETMYSQRVKCGADLLEFNKRLTEFLESSRENGAADEKTKQLSLVRLAWMRRCRFCAEGQIQRALEAGASQDEVVEVLLMTLARAEEVVD